MLLDYPYCSYSQTWTTSSSCTPTSGGLCGRRSTIGQWSWSTAQDDGPNIACGSWFRQLRFWGHSALAKSTRLGRHWWHNFWYYQCEFYGKKPCIRWPTALIHISPKFAFWGLQNSNCDSDGKFSKRSKSQKIYGIPMAYQTFLSNFVKPMYYPTACKTPFGTILIATCEIITREGKVQSVWASQWRWTVSSCPISVVIGWVQNGSVNCE